MTQQLLAARIPCQECEFVIEVEPRSEAHPIDVVIQHRQETGHELQMEPLEE